MELSKKGIFFTFAAISLSLIIIFSFNTFKEFGMKENVDIIAIRIETMNNFIKDVEQDLEKGLFIASFRALASMEQYIADKGVFITDLEDNFNELVLEGTLESEQFSLMTDSTFRDWADKIEIEADKIDVIVNFTINEVSLSQDDPWKVTVNSNVNIKVKDKKNTSSWDRNKEITTRVSIEDFEDPLYIVNSNGRVTNTIVNSPNIVNILNHLNNSYYIESDSAPNFLNRLQGDLSNSTTGIESLVNLDEFKEQGLSTKVKSVVDYIYFGSNITTDCNVEETLSWFKLDQPHLAIYGVTCFEG